MMYTSSAGVLTLAIALLPVLRAWPTTSSATPAPSDAPTSPDDSEFLGRIEFPCGEDINDWIVNVSIGTPPQTFPLLIDTTHPYSYVSGVKCTTEYCLKGKRYDVSKSSTAKDKDIEATLILANESQSVDGKVYSDTFLFGDVPFDEIPFIDVEDTKDLIYKGYAGSFAIGIPDEDIPDDFEDRDQKYRKRANGASLVGGSPPSVRGASGRGRRRKRDSNSTVEVEYCSLDFGVDLKSIRGEIAWLDLPTSGFGKTPLWKTQLKGVKSGDCISLDFDNTLASFDSNIGKIQVPESDLDKIHNALGATCVDGSTAYLFECSKATNLTFSFEHYDISLPADSWTRKSNTTGKCTTVFEKSQVFDEPLNRWELGTDFLEEFYSIYDLQYGQIGLGLVVDGSDGVSIQPK